MAKFLFIYSGPYTDMDDFDEEAAKKEMDEWSRWMGENKGMFIDDGGPVGEPEVVVDDGSSKKPLEILGYSLVEAADMHAAKKITKNCPMLREKTGKYAVEIFKLLPM